MSPMLIWGFILFSPTSNTSRSSSRHQRADVHVLARRHCSDEARGLVLADGAEKPHARRAELLDVADLAELAPPIVIGHEVLDLTDHIT
jgi:hypothetical protein